MAVVDVQCVGIQVHTEMLQKHVLYLHGMEPTDLKDKGMTWAFQKTACLFF
jgi:hypothetical protein